MKQVIQKRFPHQENIIYKLAEVHVIPDLDFELEGDKSHYFLPVTQEQVNVESLLSILDEWESTVYRTLDLLTQQREKEAGDTIMELLTPLNEMAIDNPVKYKATGLIACDYKSLPRDARNDFVRKPTVLHLALLTIAITTDRNNEALVSLFKEKVDAVIRMGLSSGGRNPQELLLWSIQILSVAGTFSLIRELCSTNKNLNWLEELYIQCKELALRCTNGVSSMSRDYISNSEQALASLCLSHFNNQADIRARLSLYYQRLSEYEKRDQRFNLQRALNNEFKLELYQLMEQYVAENQSSLVAKADDLRPSFRVFASKGRKIYSTPFVAFHVFDFSERFISMLSELSDGRFYNIKEQHEETIVYINQMCQLNMNKHSGEIHLAWVELTDYSYVRIHHLEIDTSENLAVYLQIVIN